MHADDDISIVVYGEAQPAGSKTAFRHPHTKQVIVKDANDGAKDWKDSVRQAAGQQYQGEILTGPVVLEVIFYRQRNKGHYGTGRNAGILKDSAPAYPITKPDTTKLLRGTEDALTGIVYRDDSQVVHQVASKRFGNPVRVEIKVRQMDFDTVGAARQAELLAA